MAEKQTIVISKRLIAVNSASSVLARILNITVLVWMYQYLLKNIPAEEFAVYPVVTAIMVFAPLFFAFLTSGVSRHIVDAYARDDLEDVRRIISSIVPMLTAAAGLFLLGGLLFAAHIEQILNITPSMVSDARFMMALLVVSFSLQMFALPFATGYHVRQKFVELNLLGVAREMFRILLTLIFLLGIGAEVIWVVIANVTAELIFQAVIVYRSLRMAPDIRFDRRLIDGPKARSLLSFGLWTTLGRLGGMMYTNAATIMLNLHGSAVDVTSYFIGATLYRQLDGMIGAATLPLQPALTALNATQERRRLASAVFRGGRYALWFAMAVATPLMIYADVFIDLYIGEVYSDAAMIIVLFMIIYPFNKPTVLLPMTAMAMARVREFFLPAFLFQLFGLGLMYLFATEFDMGAVGVTLALTIITIGSQLSYFWRLTFTLTETTLSDFARRVLAPGFAPALGGAVVWYALKLAAPIEGWIHLGLVSALGGVAYLTVLFLFCLDEGERGDLRHGLQKVGLASR